MTYWYFKLGEVYISDIREYARDVVCDGRAVIYFKNPVADEENELPDEYSYTVNLDEAKVNEMIDWAIKYKIYKKGDIGMDGCDGYRSYLTFYMPEAMQVGGYLPENRRYEEIVACLNEMMDIKYYMDQAQSAINEKFTY